VSTQLQLKINKLINNNNNNIRNHLIHTSHFTLLRFTDSTCFGHYLPLLRRHYTNAGLVTVVCGCRCGLVSGCGNMSRLWTAIKWNVKCVSSWYCLLRNYVTMIHGQQNIKYVTTFLAQTNYMPLVRH
jgi:hypothetical protein